MSEIAQIWLVIVIVMCVCELSMDRWRLDKWRWAVSPLKVQDVFDKFCHIMTKFQLRMIDHDS